jgi:hypothetical protein
VAGLVVVAGAAGLVFAWRGGEASQEEDGAGSTVEAPSATAAATPAAVVSPAAAPARQDTTRELLDAAQRAVAWHADAVIAEIRAELVAGGVSGPRRTGALEIEYGQPKQGFGPGAPLKAERLLITYPEDAPGSQKPVRSQGSPIGLPEPNCPLEVAWSTAVQSGLSREEPLRLRYAFEQKLRRAVWRVSGASGTPVRTLDGNSCAVLSNR